MGESSSTRITSIRAFKLALHEAVEAEHVRPANAADAFARAQPEIVVEPGTEQEVARVLRMASEAGLAVIPRGGGTKMEWGNSPRQADVVLSLARMDRILEHAWADLTVTVEAGCPLQKLQTALAEHGQCLALDAAWPERATIGGMLSTNDSGAWRLRYGSLRDLVIGVTVALPDGTLASSGGKVVKNVAGYDLPKLLTGSLGTLGVITRAVFRLHPLPKNSRTITILTRDVNEVQRLLLSIQDSKLAHVALQARVFAGAPPELNILLEGTERGVAAQFIQLGKIAGAATVKEGAPEVWRVREELWADWEQSSGEQISAAAVAKISILPSWVASTMVCLEGAADPLQLRWRAILQATGIGWVRLDGSPPALLSGLTALRQDIEQKGGSLVLLQKSARTSDFEAWGNAGDAVWLMRAVKRQLDPRNTLNPGRFVGGI